MAEAAAMAGVAYDPSMQDWPLEVTDSTRLTEFLDHYSREDRTEHRHALAQLIAFSLDDAFASEEPSPHVLERASEVFRSDEALREYLACREARGEDDTFAITRWIRTL